ncbi:fibroblast growth factor 21 [Genypterus blacodes]|uniref:fibroblast growth factor 21 n=1 Tax=Genypterus blacodes TaxID=154954 RepID=UPI003F768BEE
MSLSLHASLSSSPSLLFIFSLPFSFAFYLPDSNPLLSFNMHVRETHLYTENHRRGMYLQMTPDGGVSGSAAQTQYSVLELKSVQQGQTVIRGQLSSLFLCLDSRGHLRGQSVYAEADCSFTELLLADGYTRFLSSHDRLPVSLAPKHLTDRHSLPFTRFLPLRNTLTVETVTERPPTNHPSFNMDSEDLFGMSHGSIVSPHFSGEK